MVETSCDTPQCPIHPDGIVTRAGRDSSSSLPRFRCRSVVDSPHLFSAAVDRQLSVPAPACPDHPDGHVTFWGSYRSAAGPAKRVRCVPMNAPAHTFVSRSPDQLELALAAAQSPGPLLPREFSVATVARTLSRLARGASYRSASLSARLESGVPGSESWSLSARWCQALAPLVLDLLLPAAWPRRAAVVPLALPDSSAMLVGVVDLESSLPVRVRLSPAGRMASLPSSIPSWLPGAPSTLVACPQVLSGFPESVERRATSVGWVEWATLEGLSAQQAKTIDIVMQERFSTRAAAEELARALGFVPTADDELVRQAITPVFQVRDRLLRRGGLFRNVQRTEALASLLILDAHGLASAEQIGSALLKVWSEPIPQAAVAAPAAEAVRSAMDAKRAASVAPLPARTG